MLCLNSLLSGPSPCIIDLVWPEQLSRAPSVPRPCMFLAPSALVPHLRLLPVWFFRPSKEAQTMLRRFVLVFEQVSRVWDISRQQSCDGAAGGWRREVRTRRSAAHPQFGTAVWRAGAHFKTLQLSALHRLCFVLLPVSSHIPPTLPAPPTFSSVSSSTSISISLSCGSYITWLEFFFLVNAAASRWVRLSWLSSNTVLPPRFAELASRLHHAAGRRVRASVRRPLLNFPRQAGSLIDVSFSHPLSERGNIESNMVLFRISQHLSTGKSFWVWVGMRLATLVPACL